MTNATDSDVYALFWDHVEELRCVFLRILLIIFFGVVTTFLCHGPIITFMKAPLTELSPLPKQLKQEEKLESFRVVNNQNQTITYQLSHALAETIHATSRVKTLSDGLYQIPPGESIIYKRPADTSMQLLIFGPLEGMVVALKLSFWLGIVATSPIWLLLLLKFIAPALRREEKGLIAPFLFLSLGFIAFGTLFAYFLTIPLANHYLMTFNQSIGLNAWSLAHYLDYTLFLLLANGLAFELAAVGLFAVHLGIVSAKALVSNRRFAIVASFIIGALLTPPDLLTKLMLAIPLIFLYECVILFAKLRSYRSMPKQEQRL